ncbi:MAG TPA: efflux RND transporter periplasmic adaptor subunit [Armatimonadota bacterium]|nr:efflux RND transporter periplasmic adaptor subunit [Armatimonadota bacterium]
MEQQPGRRRKISTRLAIVIVVILLAILAIILVNVYRHRPPTSIQVSGIIEATQITLSSQVNARVLRVNVDEGDSVREGELLVSLKDTSLQDQVRQAEAALAAAQAMYKEALAGPRPQDIQQAQAMVEQSQAAVAGAHRQVALAEQALAESRELQARLQTAETNYRTSQAALDQAEARSRQASEDYRRAQELFQRGAIAANQLDAARAAAESASAQVEQAKSAVQGAERSLQIARSAYSERTGERQQLTTAQTQYETSQAQLAAAQAKLNELRAGTRPEQIQQAKAQVQQAQAAVAQAESQLAHTRVESPTDATVITRAVEPGDLGTVGSTLLVLADLRTVKLKVYVEEPYYGRIRLGQSADVTVDSYPNEVFHGRVSEIADQAEFTPKEIQTKEQRAKLVFAVTILLSNPNDKLKPGMPADAVLKLMPVSEG